jgi:hypothetical protein
MKPALPNENEQREKMMLMSGAGGRLARRGLMMALHSDLEMVLVHENKNVLPLPQNLFFPSSRTL